MPPGRALEGLSRQDATGRAQRAVDPKASGGLRGRAGLFDGFCYRGSHQAEPADAGRDATAGAWPSGQHRGPRLSRAELPADAKAAGWDRQEPARRSHYATTDAADPAAIKGVIGSFSA